MFDFNTLPELFKHIQVNNKTPSYLNYTNSTSIMILLSKVIKTYKNESVNVMNYAISDTDKSHMKEYDGIRLNNRKLQGGGL